MSKKLYAGVNNIAQDISKFYVGVNGVARKVVKGYVGVNGVARLFWDGGSPVTGGSWDYWTTSDNFEIIDDYGHDLYKTNKLIAYYAVVYQDTNRYTPLLMSPDPDAVTYSIYDESTGTSTSYTYNGTVTDVNNITWYYCYGGDLYFDTEPEFNISALQMADAAQDLLDLIYAVPFHEDYQAGESYTIYYGDKLKTVRKVAGTFLAQFYPTYATASDAGLIIMYELFSDNIDTIISTLMAYGTQQQWNYVLAIYQGGTIELRVYSTSATITPITINSRTTWNGFDMAIFRTGSVSFSGKKAVVGSTGGGTISYSTDSTNITDHVIGVRVQTWFSFYVNSESVGVDL